MHILPAIPILVLQTIVATVEPAASDHRTWDAVPDRTWLGTDFWANRLQDWRIRDGRVECIERRPKMAQRTAHLLTRSISNPDAIDGTLRISVDTGAIDPTGGPDPKAWSGLLIGAGNETIDHRLTAQVHHVPAEDGGLLCVVDETGRIELLRNDRPLVDQASWSISRTVTREQLPAVDGVQRDDLDVESDRPFHGRLDLSIDCKDGRCDLVARAIDRQGRVRSTVRADNVDPSLIDGCIALVSTRGRAGHWFDELKMEGSLLQRHDERAWGPVLMSQYTIDEGTLKLTAQLPPLEQPTDQ